MTLVFKQMTLGIMSHKNLWSDSQGIKTTGGFGRQIEEFSHYFNKTILVIPFENQRVDSPGYVIHIHNLEIIPLPKFDPTGWRGKVDFLIKTPHMLRILWHAFPKCDIWQYRLPGYIGILGLCVHKLRRSRPAFAWLGTDWTERILQSGASWLRGLMARFASTLLAWATRDVPVFALGNLENSYRSSNPYVHQTFSTILSGKNILSEPRLDMASPPRLLYVGRLSSEKGVIFLFEAIRTCLDQGDQLDLTVVGEGAERSILEQSVLDLELQDCVQFRGYIPLGDDLWDIYKHADIFILPSLTEGQGKVLIEAMAAGLPIIATRVGGIPMIIQHEHNGLLVEPRSSQAIALALQNLIHSPELRYTLSESARNSTWQYTIEMQTEILMNQLHIDLKQQGWF